MTLTKADAVDAGFDTLKAYKEFLAENPEMHPNAGDIEGVDIEGSDEETGGEITLTTDENEVPESDGEERNKKMRDLAPEALGFDLGRVGDVSENDLPDFAMRDSKYGQYFTALHDSFQRDTWKVVTVPDPEALGDALRNAAVRLGYGLEVRLYRDESGALTGDVYFKAREKRAKSANGSKSESDDATE